MAIKPKTGLGVRESVGSAANLVAPADGDGMTGCRKTIPDRRKGVSEGSPPPPTLGLCVAFLR